MKRLFCVLLALALAGCASAPSGSTASRSAPADAGAGPLAMAAGTVNGAGFFSFSYDADNGGSGLRLARWDFADMTVHIPCTLAGCDHTGDACEARVGGYPLLVLEDAVYVLEREPDEESFSLYERDGQGLHPRRVGETGYWSFCGADEEYLYGFCDGAFGRVSRADGAETYLAHGLQEDFSNYGRILGVWQDRFVAVNWDLSNEQPVRICLLDRDGTVTEAAQVDPAHFSDYNCVFAGGEVFYLDLPTGDVTAVDVDTGALRTASRALRPYNALEEGDFYKCQRWYLLKVQDHIVVRVADFVQDALEQTVFLVNENGSVTELPQRQEMRGFDPALNEDLYNYYVADEQPVPVSVLGEWDDRLVVRCALQLAACETDEGPLYTVQDVYALTGAEDYLAGRETYREFAPAS